MRWAARRDANEREIVDALRAVGCDVFQTDEIDLVVGYRSANWFLEIKMTGREKKLRPRQIELATKWRGQYAVVTTAEQALRVIGAIK